MSVKHAAVTSATTTARDSRRFIRDALATKTRNHEGTRTCFVQDYFVHLRVLRDFVARRLRSAAFQVQTSQRRDEKIHRLLEAMRRNGLGFDAAEVAGVAAAVDGAVAVENLDVATGMRHADP